MSSLVRPLERKVKYAPRGTRVKKIIRRNDKLIILESAALALAVDWLNIARAFFPPSFATI